jgi:cytoskeleton protein RodZ
MNESELPVDVLVPAPTPTTGRLRQAREAAGLHIAVLATLLKVPVKKLEALEQGRYHELPDLTFARALASSACRHLKIDPAPVLAELPGMQLAALTQMAIDDKPAYRVVDRGGLSTWSLPAWLAKPPVWMAGGLLVLAAVVYWWPQVPAPLAEQPVAVLAPSAPLAAPVSPAPDTPAAPLAETPLVVSAQPVAPTDAPVPAATAVADAAVANAGVSAEAAADPVAGGDLLRIVGQGDSWLEVVDARGTVLLRRMLRAGEEHRFNTQPPYRVLLGNAGAAQVMVRGKEFDTAPHIRNSVARFEVQ